MCVYVCVYVCMCMCVCAYACVDAGVQVCVCDELAHGELPQPTLVTKSNA